MRNRYDSEQQTEEEKKIIDAIRAVEAMGAHEFLTKCVFSLTDALFHLGTFVDRRRPDDES